MKVLILSADTWAMVDEVTKKSVSGVSVWYVNDYREDTAESFGAKPTKISCSDEVFATLKTAKLPAYFDLSFGAKPGAGNKASLVLNGVANGQAIDLFGAAPAAKKA